MENVFSPSGHTHTATLWALTSGHCVFPSDGPCSGPHSGNPPCSGRTPILAWLLAEAPHFLLGLFSLAFGPFLSPSSYPSACTPPWALSFLGPFSFCWPYPLPFIFCTPFILPLFYLFFSFYFVSYLCYVFLLFIC